MGRIAQAAQPLGSRRTCHTGHAGPAIPANPADRMVAQLAGLPWRKPLAPGVRGVTLRRLQNAGPGGSRAVGKIVGRLQWAQTAQQQRQWRT